jgi:hypothetical protein
MYLGDRASVAYYTLITRLVTYWAAKFGETPKFISLLPRAAVETRR